MGSYNARISQHAKNGASIPSIGNISRYLDLSAPNKSEKSQLFGLLERFAQKSAIRTLISMFINKTISGTPFTRTKHYLEKKTTYYP